MKGKHMIKNFIDPLMIETDLKRKLKLAAAAKTGINLNDDPKTRVSYYNHDYPLSAEKDWTNYPGIGWIHATESDRFLYDHRVCAVSGEWANRTKMKRMAECEGNGWVTLKVLKASADLAIDSYTDRVCYKKNLVKALNSDGSPIEVDRDTISSFFFRWKHDGNYWPSDSAIRLYWMDDEEIKSDLVPSAAVDKVGGKCRCQCCGKEWKREWVCIREDLGDDWADHKLCPSCYEKKLGLSQIRPHNYDGYPNPIYVTKHYYEYGKKLGRINKRLFGWEAETEMHKTKAHAAGFDRWKLATMVKKCLGTSYVMVKEDGSLNMNGKYSDEGNRFAGFEIVSAPADLAVHREKLPLIEKMVGYQYLRAWDTTTCGFHVHVSRESLTTLQIGRIIAFTTHPKNKALIQKVAGRGEMKYCAYHPKTISSSRTTEHKSDETRRVAVNTTNPRTIEFRIFRGTIHPRHMIRNIEFCDAICDYCYPASRSMQELFSDEGFIQFVINHRSIGGDHSEIMTWPLLAAWMVKNNLADKSKLIGPVDDVPESGDDLHFERDTTKFDPIGLKLVRPEAHAAKKIAKAEAKKAKVLIQPAAGGGLDIESF